jgi:cell division septation protein DedD
MPDRDVREIPLSGKQLVFLFMSGVVLLVVVFLLGVSVGRGVDDTPIEASDTSVPIDAPPTETSPADLGFHDELTAAGAGAEAANPDPQPPPPPPVATPPPEPREAAPPPPSTGAEEGWKVQVGAYGTTENADRVLARLTELGYPAFISPTGSLQRVRVGPYADRAEAERVAASLEREGFDPSITR